MPGRDKKQPENDASAEEIIAAEEDAELAAELEAELDEFPEAALQTEVASLKDQLLRALAETENLRRRSQREREDALKYAAVPFIRELVGVVDNLRRAMDSVSPEALEADEHLKTLMAGLEMTEKELAAVFERHHIVTIEPLGERFDPHNHQAMFELPNPEAPSGTVVQVIQVGYRLHDRLLRPAQVGISKGGPAPAPQPEPQPEAKPQDQPQTAPEAAGNDDETLPGSTIDTSA